MGLLRWCWKVGSNFYIEPLKLKLTQGLTAKQNILEVVHKSGLPWVRAIVPNNCANWSHLELFKN